MNWSDYADQIISNGWFQLGFLIVTLAMMQFESYYAPPKSQPGWRRVVYWVARVYGWAIWVAAIVCIILILGVVAFALILRFL